MGSRHDIYTRHVSTPTGLDFAAAARLYGLEHELVSELPAFRSALERAIAADASEIIEVRTVTGGERRSAPTGLGFRRRGPQLARRGSRADSLTSVSASSRAGSESRTMPFPA